MKIWLKKAIGLGVATFFGVAVFICFGNTALAQTENLPLQPANQASQTDQNEAGENPDPNPNADVDPDPDPNPNPEIVPDKTVPPATSAKQDKSDLLIEVQQGKKTISKKTYTYADLQGLPQKKLAYTSFDEEGTPQKTWAEGVPLENLVALMGVDATQISNFRIYSSEGWDRSFTYNFLYGVNRYYYPNLIEAFRTSTMEQAADDNELIVPLLALRSANKLMPKQDEWDSMDASKGMAICYGQLNPKDVCSSLYGSHLIKLVICLKNPTQDSGVGVGAGTLLVGGSDDITDNVAENVTTVIKTENDTENYKVPAQIAVRIGYLGYGEPVLRKTFSFDELRQLSKIKQAMTALDEQGNLVMETAVGFRLVDLVAAAGIDLNAVQSFTFYNENPNTSKGLSLSRKYLLETPRYYYPELPNNWDGATASPLPGATLGATRVPTMLAWKDYWDVGSAVPDFYDIKGNNRFRLTLGQAKPNDQTAANFMPWISTIDIMIVGKPPANGGGNLVSSQLAVQTNTNVKANSSKQNSETGDNYNISGKLAAVAAKNVVAPEKKIYELAQTVALPNQTDNADAVLAAVGGVLLAMGVGLHCFSLKKLG